MATPGQGMIEIGGEDNRVMIGVDNRVYEGPNAEAAFNEEVPPVDSGGFKMSDLPSVNTSGKGNEVMIGRSCSKYIHKQDEPRETKEISRGAETVVNSFPIQASGDDESRISLDDASVSMDGCGSHQEQSMLSIRQEVNVPKDSVSSDTDICHASEQIVIKDDNLLSLEMTKVSVSTEENKAILDQSPLYSIHKSKEELVSKKDISTWKSLDCQDDEEGDLKKIKFNWRKAKGGQLIPIDSSCRTIDIHVGHVLTSGEHLSIRGAEQKQNRVVSLSWNKTKTEYTVVSKLQFKIIGDTDGHVKQKVIEGLERDDHYYCRQFAESLYSDFQGIVKEFHPEEMVFQAAHENDRSVASMAHALGSLENLFQEIVHQCTGNPVEVSATLERVDGLVAARCLGDQATACSDLDTSLGLCSQRKDSTAQSVDDFDKHSTAGFSDAYGQERLAAIEAEQSSQREILHQIQMSLANLVPSIKAIVQEAREPSMLRLMPVSPLEAVKLDQEFLQSLGGVDVPQGSGGGAAVVQEQDVEGVAVQDIGSQFSQDPWWQQLSEEQTCLAPPFASEDQPLVKLSSQTSFHQSPALSLDLDSLDKRDQESEVTEARDGSDQGQQDSKVLEEDAESRDQTTPKQSPTNDVGPHKRNVSKKSPMKPVSSAPVQQPELKLRPLPPDLDLSQEADPADPADLEHSGLDNDENDSSSSESQSAGARPKNKGVSAERLISLIRAAYEGQGGAERQIQKLTQSLEAALVEESPASPRALTMGTVICVDCSDSIKEGGSFDNTIKLANDIIDGLEDIAEEYGLEENVAVVSMSGGARVVQHLTNDYFRVRDAIDSLQPGGRSPFFEALVVCLAALQGKGGAVDLSGVQVRPRVIFITDGKLTDETQVSGSDSQGSKAPAVKVPVIRLITELGSKVSRSTPSPFVWIPVGDADKEFLKSLSAIGNGQVAGEKDIPKLCRYLRIQDTIGKTYACVKTSYKEDYIHVDGSVENVARGLVQHIHPDDMAEIAATVRRKLKASAKERKPDDFDYVYENPRLAPLGSRVKRSSDWKKADPDKDDPGTVINHDYDKKYMWVQWDSGEMDHCRYGDGGVFDVSIVDGHPRIPNPEEYVLIGVKVTRGQHWQSGDVDGGEGMTGVVIRRRRDIEVKVRWDNGNIYTHTYGRHGVYELHVCDPSQFKRDDPILPEHLIQDDVSRLLLPKSTGSGTLKPMVTASKAKPHVIWQWRDDLGQWRLYADDLQVKVNQEYDRRPDGSCLVKRDGRTWRLFFKTMQEKSLETAVRHDIQRLGVSKDELRSLKLLEKSMMFY